jgi:hypothetical protein
LLLPLEEGEEEERERSDIMKREASVIALVLYERQGPTARVDTKSE